MFIPLKRVLIGIDPYPYIVCSCLQSVIAVRLNDSQQGQQQRGLPCTRTTNDASNLEIDALQETQTWRNMVWLVVLSHPSEKYDFVSWHDYSQYMESHENPYINHVFPYINHIFMINQY